MEDVSGFIGKNLANDHEQLVVPISLFVAVICLCIVIGHLLEENRWVNESITAIFIVLTSFNPLFICSLSLSLFLISSLQFTINFYKYVSM